MSPDTPPAGDLEGLRQALQHAHRITHQLEMTYATTSAIRAGLQAIVEHLDGDTPRSITQPPLPYPDQKHKGPESGSMCPVRGPFELTFIDGQVPEHFEFRPQELALKFYPVAADVWRLRIDQGQDFYLELDLAAITPGGST